MPMNQRLPEGVWMVSFDILLQTRPAWWVHSSWVRLRRPLAQVRAPVEYF
jgi:hypothetical protein